MKNKQLVNFNVCLEIISQEIIKNILVNLESNFVIHILFSQNRLKTRFCEIAQVVKVKNGLLFL